MQGSSIVECPDSASTAPGGSSVCVGMPNDDAGRTIISTYQTLLDERGFEFSQYIGGPNVALLKKGDGSSCEFMIFGLPYLPPEERTNFLLAFQHYFSKPGDCEIDFTNAAPG